MTDVLKKSVLLKPIRDLVVSDEFKLMAVKNGFETLEEILCFRLSSLQKKENFTIHVSNELYRLLQKEGLVEMLKIS